MDVDNLEKVVCYLNAPTFTPATTWIFFMFQNSDRAVCQNACLLIGIKKSKLKGQLRIDLSYFVWRLLSLTSALCDCDLVRLTHILRREASEGSSRAEARTGSNQVFILPVRVRRCFLIAVGLGA